MLIHLPCWAALEQDPKHQAFEYTLGKGQKMFPKKELDEKADITVYTVDMKPQPAAAAAMFRTVSWRGLGWDSRQEIVLLKHNPT